MRRWKLLRRVVLRIASAKTAAGWTKWVEVAFYVPGRLRAARCQCSFIGTLKGPTHCRCSMAKHLALRFD